MLNFFFLWLCQNSYWKWPSRNSWFTLNSMVICHSYICVCLPEGKHHQIIYLTIIWIYDYIIKWGYAIYNWGYNWGYIPLNPHFFIHSIHRFSGHGWCQGSLHPRGRRRRRLLRQQLPHRRSQEICYDGETRAARF